MRSSSWVARSVCGDLDSSFLNVKYLLIRVSIISWPDNKSICGVQVVVSAGSKYCVEKIWTRRSSRSRLGNAEQIVARRDESFQADNDAGKDDF